MNLPATIRKEARENLVKTANLMIDGKINLIEGARDLLGYADSADIYEDDMFLPIIGFTSETDDYPIGEIRKNWNKDYLNELDEKAEKYIKLCKPGLISDCKKIIKKITTKYTCPCCGYKTLDEKPPGTFDICDICFWEDDNVQFDDPDYAGGANDASLRQAQKNFQEFGASELRVLEYVRKPDKTDVKDPKWKKLI